MKTLNLTSDLSSLSVIDYVIEDIKHLNFLGEDIPVYIQVVLCEAISNAIIHGNEFDSDKHVELKYYVKNGFLHFSVKDEGEGFHLSSVDNPTTAANVETCGGRGVFLVKELCSFVEYCNDSHTFKFAFPLK